LLNTISILLEQADYGSNKLSQRIFLFSAVKARKIVFGRRVLVCRYTIGTFCSHYHLRKAMSKLPIGAPANVEI
jgi:hypothetical protein